jgi:hypothetical protein
VAATLHSTLLWYTGTDTDAPNCGVWLDRQVVYHGVRPACLIPWQGCRLKAYRTAFLSGVCLFCNFLTRDYCRLAEIKMGSHSSAENVSGPLLCTAVVFLLLETCFVLLLYIARYLAPHDRERGWVMEIFLTATYSVCVGKVVVAIRACTPSSYGHVS